MERFTKQVEGHYIVEEKDIVKDNNYTGNAIERLGKLEDAIESMHQNIEDLTKKLEKMKQENNTKTYTFRETMALKGMNKTLLAMFESYCR